MDGDKMFSRFGDIQNSPLLSLSDILNSNDLSKFSYQFLDMYMELLCDYRKEERDIDESLIVAFFLRAYAKEKLFLERTGGACNQPKNKFKTAQLERKMPIPRETLRRKLISLEVRGIVEKSGADGWSIRVQDGKPVVSLSALQVLESQMALVSKLLSITKAPTASS